MRRARRAWFADGEYRQLSQALSSLHAGPGSSPAGARTQASPLDQLAISNLLKTTLKEPAGHKFTEDRAATQSGYWPQLLNRLERLVHLNLLVCPRSKHHELEAAFDDRLSGHLRSFHEQLAANVQFEHQLTVERFQLEMSCVAWLNSREPESLGRGEVVRGRLDAWLDRFVVNAYYPVTPDEISRLRAERDRIDGGLRVRFVRWRDEGPREFDALFGEQVDGLRAWIREP